MISNPPQMGIMPTNAVAPPPLPAGWTEHTAPTGHVYYYHAQTNQSSYIRPLPPLHLSASGPSQKPPDADTNTAEKPAKKSKKEKPSVKTPIAGTPWLRVKTTAGNVFYTHTERKESLWEVPEEIADAVKALERQEVEEEAVKKIREMEEKMASMKSGGSDVSEVGTKRKADDPAEGRELLGGKKLKVEEETAEDDQEEDEAGDDAWQREMAQEMATEDIRSVPPVDEVMQDQEVIQEESSVASKELPSNYNMPQQVNLSPEEARALFKTLLQEKDISPLTPYDSAIPLLVKDPRYVLLPSLADRHAAFNEYCLEKSRALRAARIQGTSNDASASSSSGDPKIKAKDAYEQLLKDELKSTRTGWDEFRKQWKKDRRFFGYGRDDKEREKLFREWRNTLGERKRKEAEAAEKNFYALLREQQDLVTGEAKDGNDPAWKDVKRLKSISSDPRYDAVGSSSLREELFAAYLKAQLDESGHGEQASKQTPPDNTAAVSGETEEEKKRRIRKERADKATKEREEQVRRDKAKVERQIDKSKGSLSHEKAVEEYMTLLTDAIREPTATYTGSLELLSRSPGFMRSPLPGTQLVGLFNSHVEKIRQKQLTALYAVFEGHAPGLDAQFKDLPPSVLKSAPAIKLGLGRDDDDPTFSEVELRHFYDEWQAERFKRARADFDKLLGENAFVGFWAGLGKMAGGAGKDGGDGTIVPGVDTADEQDEGGEGEGGGGRADLKALAKSIGGKQIEDVLKHDRRYRVFDYAPEQREQWIKEYVSRMSAPKLSVHVPNE